MITGSVAMSVYSVPRLTRDIDLVVDIKADDVDTIVEMFENDCYINPDVVRKETRRRGMFNIIHKEWITKADFIVKKDQPYRKAEFERRKSIDIKGFSVYVVTPEDLILSKLCWGKLSSSELQQQDVRRLLSEKQDLDRVYLKRWARKLGVAGELEALGLE